MRCSTLLHARRVFTGLALVLGVGAPATDAWAQSDDESSATLANEPAVRRSGFMLGLTVGANAGSARGYPNDVGKIDRPEYLTETGFGAGAGGVLWIGGALTDWFSVGLGVASSSIGGEGGLVGSGAAFLFRVETFPFFYRGGAWQDFGLLLNAGTGGFRVEDGSETRARGAGISVIGVGTFWEPVRWWRLSMGPALEYTHHFSDSIRVNTALLGWRTAFYGGP